MSDLVSTADQKTFMGVSGSTDDTLIGDLLTHVEDMLERACNRQHRPFLAAQTGVTEVHDGTGNGYLFLHYPISDVTSIKLGHDPATPDETVDPDDLDCVTWVAGSRRIARTDSGTFGSRGDPRYVQVVYNAAADLPDICKLALKRAVATIYRQRGSEDVIGHNEALGSYSHTLSVIEEDSIWKMAVAQQWEAHV